ncbi:uncharacterized protein MAM_00237 [Metarhizium album ARSEF 1941]|uniref:Cell cycle control protein n=1 Tax=Metarhizium album (strain ARSEF 1941) TaxID=1081103 RepID=A0A0B2X7J9_METAS|nr:uncharacterized protein MAM_00237 [Metarhizium album ARSEF 1941]KHO01236.1 hypothetical protein MAM_00237 [Metarhizium album ARSEF 1941]
MAEVEDALLELLSEDDLVEIPSSPPHLSFDPLQSLPIPMQQIPAQPLMLRPSRRSDRRPSPPVPMPQRQSQPQQRQSTAFIDLTEEPDSPAEIRQSQPQSQIGRNPRRTNSQRITPPSLSRSDSNFIGPGASVIDLTADSPEDEGGPEPRVTRSQRHHHHHHHHHLLHHHHRRATFAQDQLIELEFINANSGSIYSNLSNNVRRLAGIFARGFTATPIEFPPTLTPRDASPKPPMEPTPPTRHGFTRDTSLTDERVVVCPACGDELAYDPTGAAPQQGPASTSGKKRKRAPGEHHFWALKKCGHVYCADCFENRKPTKANPLGVGFRVPLGKAPGTPPNDIRCAVESCDSKVSLKTEWVGIYL